MIRNSTQTNEELILNDCRRYIGTCMRDVAMPWLVDEQREGKVHERLQTNQIFKTSYRIYLLFAVHTQAFSSCMFRIYFSRYNFVSISLIANQLLLKTEYVFLGYKWAAAAMTQQKNEFAYIRPRCYGLAMKKWRNRSHQLSYGFHSALSEDLKR